MNIVKIRPSKNKDAIELMEEALEMVKSGEITSIALSWVTKDGGIGGDFSAGNDPILQWSSLRHCEMSFYKDIIIQE